MRLAERDSLTCPTSNPELGMLATISDEGSQETNVADPENPCVLSTITNGT
jgi:hypothetical protein